MKRVSLALVMGCLVGCSVTTAEGRFVDGMSGDPIAEVGVVARASDPDAGGVTCASFETKTDAAGAFVLEGLCAGAYDLTLSDKSWWLADGGTVPDGGGAGLEFKAWRAPSGSGMYVLGKDGIDPIRTSADLKKAKILDTETDVLYPKRVPARVSLLASDQHLVLVGRDTIDALQIAPLIHSGERKLRTGDAAFTMQPWYYIGVRFEDDTTFEKVPASFDKAKILVKERGDRLAWFVAHDAVPPGRYALYAGPGARSVTVLDFGQPFKKPPAE